MLSSRKIVIKINQSAVPKENAAEISYDSETNWNWRRIFAALASVFLLLPGLLYVVLHNSMQENTVQQIPVATDIKSAIAVPAAPVVIPEVMHKEKQNKKIQALKGHANPPVLIKKHEAAKINKRSVSDSHKNST